MSVKIEIETCKQCPNLKKESYLTNDSFDHEVNWICGKSDRPAPPDRDWKPKVDNSSRIAMVAWPSEEPKRIPCWCPLRDENKGCWCRNVTCEGGEKCPGYEG